MKIALDERSHNPVRNQPLPASPCGPLRSRGAQAGQGSRADHGGAFWGSVGNEFSLKRLNFSSKAQNWKEEYERVPEQSDHLMDYDGRSRLPSAKPSGLFPQWQGVTVALTRSVVGSPARRRR